jgi:hypothetical protein
LPAGLFAAMTSHWLRDLRRRQPGPLTEPYLQAKRLPVEEAGREAAVAENHSDVAAVHAEELAGFDHQDTGHGAAVHDKP